VEVIRQGLFNAGAHGRAGLTCAHHEDAPGRGERVEQRQGGIGECGADEILGPGGGHGRLPNGQSMAAQKGSWSRHGGSSKITGLVVGLAYRLFMRTVELPIGRPRSSRRDSSATSLASDAMAKLSAAECFTAPGHGAAGVSRRFFLWLLQRV
jgi:hypothetical protein